MVVDNAVNFIWITRCQNDAFTGQSILFYFSSSFLLENFNAELWLIYCTSLKPILLCSENAQNKIISWIINSSSLPCDNKEYPWIRKNCSCPNTISHTKHVSLYREFCLFSPCIHCTQIFFTAIKFLFKAVYFSENITLSNWSFWIKILKLSQKEWFYLFLIPLMLWPYSFFA